MDNGRSAGDADPGQGLHLDRPFPGVDPHTAPGRATRTAGVIRKAAAAIDAGILTRMAARIVTRKGAGGQWPVSW